MEFSEMENKLKPKGSSLKKKTNKINKLLARLHKEKIKKSQINIIRNKKIGKTRNRVEI